MATMNNKNYEYFLQKFFVHFITEIKLNDNIVEYSSGIVVLMRRRLFCR